MFKALYESYLSPFYWIFRMFGHDFKDKYRDDIEADLFRDLGFSVASLGLMTSVYFISLSWVL